MALPFASVIIPTYSRASQLARCLQALAASSCSFDRFEVIVVNDGGEELRAESFGELPFDLTVLEQPNTGPAVARNHGAEHARGEMLAFTDDDCMPNPLWLDSLITAFEGDRTALIGGLTENVLQENCFSQTSQMLVSYIYEYYAANNLSMRFFASNNMACSRSRFLEIGGFSDQFRAAGAEDRDFSRRWINAGNKLHFTRDAVVLHAHDLNLSSFCKQHFNYGRGAYIFHKRCALVDRSKITVERAKFYMNLLFYPFSQSTGSPIVLSALLLASQIANAVGFVRGMTQGKQPATTTLTALP